VVDKTTSLLAAEAVTAGLLLRERTHRGQRIEVPMLDSALYFLWPESLSILTYPDVDIDSLPKRPTNLRLVKTSDGYVAYMAISQQQRMSLLDAIGRADLRTDPRFATVEALAHGPNFAAMNSCVDEAGLVMTTSDFIAALMDVGIPCGPVLDIAAVPHDEHVVAEGLVHEWSQADTGRVRSPIVPIRFEGERVPPRVGSPVLGADGPAILSEVGWSVHRIEQLQATGAMVVGKRRQ
jgi:crotonobetainyl-CoA:carnitine CoA-transferase CaiB-like acyl-CoA transferase